jgi:phospholipase/carboxylesterase
MTTTSSEPPVIVETGDPVSASVIWLHGLGADGYDFEPVVPQLHLPDGLAIRFIFPHAPFRPVTLNGGMVMRAWFDLFHLTMTGPQDTTGIAEAEQSIHRLIDDETAKGIHSSRIVLAGFSQGGAIALYTGLRYPKPLGGLLALSTYLPLAQSLELDRSPASKQLPVMMAHGREDHLVEYCYGQQSMNFLNDLGYDVEWHSYPMDHAVCSDEIADISNWLGRVLTTVNM